MEVGSFGVELPFVRIDVEFAMRRGTPQILRANSA